MPPSSRHGQDLLRRGAPLRVLFCTHEPLLPLSGGCTIGNLRLVERLAGRGHQVRVLSPLGIPSAQALGQLPAGVQLAPFQPWRMHRDIPWRFTRYLFYSFLYFFRLWAETGRFKPQVLLVRNSVLTLPVALVARLKGIPAALSYTDFLSALLGGNRRFPRALIRLLLAYEVRVPRLFSRVAVISRLMAQNLLAFGVDSARLTVSLDGADVRLFDPGRFSPASRRSGRRRLGLKPSDRLVMFHGTVEAHHGQDIIGRLIARAGEMDPSLKFLILAAGPGSKALQRELKGRQGVLCLPFQPPAEVARLASLAQCGMIPYAPNFGLDLVFTLKLLDYLAMGLPVVSFRLSSAQAHFGDLGQLLVSKDEADFCDNLIRASKTRPSPRARRRILKDFSWDAVTDTLCRVVESAAREAPASR